MTVPRTVLRISNGGSGAKRRQVSRSIALAGELGIATTRSYWNWVYETRSSSLHGAQSKLVAPAGWEESDDEPPEDVVKIAKAQDVLRAAVRRAIEEADFRAVFSDDSAIRARWPVEPTAATSESCPVRSTHARVDGVRLTWYEHPAIPDHWLVDVPEFQDVG